MVFNRPVARSAIGRSQYIKRKVRFISDCSICCRSSSTAIISSKLYFEQVTDRHVIPSSWELFWAGKFVREFIQIWSAIRQVSNLGQWKRINLYVCDFLKIKMEKYVPLKKSFPWVVLPSNADAGLITKSRDDVWGKLLKWITIFQSVLVLSFHPLLFSYVLCPAVVIHLIEIVGECFPLIFINT